MLRDLLARRPDRRLLGALGVAFGVGEAFAAISSFDGNNNGQNSNLFLIANKPNVC